MRNGTETEQELALGNEIKQTTKEFQGLAYRLIEFLMVAEPGDDTDTVGDIVGDMAATYLEIKALQNQQHLIAQERIVTTKEMRIMVGKERALSKLAYDQMVSKEIKDARRKRAEAQNVKREDWVAMRLKANELPEVSIQRVRDGMRSNWLSRLPAGAAAAAGFRDADKVIDMPAGRRAKG